MTILTTNEGKIDNFSARSRAFVDRFGKKTECCQQRAYEMPCSCPDVDKEEWRDGFFRSRKNGVRNRKSINKNSEIISHLAEKKYLQTESQFFITILTFKKYHQRLYDGIQFPSFLIFGYYFIR